MKILEFGGGLGNQIFGYAVYLYFKEKYPVESIFGYYNKLHLKEHNGLEIDKYFNVMLPVQPFWADIVVGLLFILKKIFYVTRFVDTGGSGPIIKNENAIYISAYRDNKKYIPKSKDWISFKIPELSERNIQILQDIRSTNSFFIHVRRGDYLSDKYKWLFDGCCTLDYYKKAISRVLQDYPDANFYLFSNDFEWCKENINVKVTEVNWNTGNDSYLDMYLMSECKGGIIANSTFSFWGAYLGREKTMVTYPLKWSNSPYGSCPKIFPESNNWIAL